jgi:hypothetical protein
MPTIEIGLPMDRRLPGNIRVVDDRGNIAAGPFLAFGKADGQTAAAHGNITRDPAQPFGDTPLGRYSVEGIRPTGPGTPYRVTRMNIRPSRNTASSAALNARTDVVFASVEAEASEGALAKATRG